VGNLKRRERKEVIHGNIRIIVFMRKKHKKTLRSRYKIGVFGRHTVKLKPSKKRQRRSIDISLECYHAITAGSIMAYWKDSIVWSKQLRQQPEDIEHSKTSKLLSIC